MIERIEVEGNRRTSGDFVRHALGVEPGAPFDAAALPALERQVLNQRLFRSVKVTAEDGGAGVVLRVSVSEKWTLVPLPVVSASRGTFTAGLVLLESNLLGEGKQLVAGALGGSGGASAFAAYRDPAVGLSRWLLSARAAAADARRERFEGEERTYGFRDRRLELSLLGGPRLDDRSSLQAGWFERRAEARSAPGFAPPPHAGPVHGPSLLLELNAADYDRYHPTGLTGRAELRQGLSLGAADREVREVSATVTGSASVAGDQAVSLTLSADHVRGDPVLDAVRLGGRIGTRGFETQGLWAEDALTAALEYQVPIWTPGWGVVTAVGFCDAGVTRWRGDTTRFLAPGAGLRVYLSQVAIPVLGFDLAWATGLGGPAASVQLGFRQ